MSFLFLKKFELLLNLTTQLDCMTGCRYFAQGSLRKCGFVSFLAVGVTYQGKTIWI